MYFIFLKISLVFQFILVLMQRHNAKSLLYLVSDMIFKTSIGLFLILYFFINKLPDLDDWDRLIICFGGVLLLFDVVYTCLPQVLLFYDVDFDPHTTVTSVVSKVEPKK